MAEIAEKRDRPQFRNVALSDLRTYRQPPNAIASILHRVSGALLFLVGLPFILYLLQQSLTSELSFERYRAVVANPLAKLVLLALIWAYLHHFCAGVRYLLLDLHVGIEKAAMRTSALAVLWTSLALTALAGLKLFGAF